MAGSHDLSFVAVRGASANQIYRRVIFARYLPRGKVRPTLFPPRTDTLGRNQSTYAPSPLSPSHILILFSRMLGCPFRSWPTHALRQTLNKYLSPYLSLIRTFGSFILFSPYFSPLIHGHEAQEHTHTHASPLPSCLSPREYKLDFGENSWRAAVLRRG